MHQVGVPRQAQLSLLIAEVSGHQQSIGIPVLLYLSCELRVHLHPPEHVDPRRQAMSFADLVPNLVHPIMPSLAADNRIFRR